ncbi:MAG: DNA polymerase IV [Deltaproteobacteria bacterium]|nr:DNA polymerase IV [Deltaproteobacteria bacterium]
MTFKLLSPKLEKHFMRWYLHVDMDAFYASVEQALNPALKGKPVIVGGRSGRGVVTSASYEARKYGVRSAMPGFQARKLCPQGIFLPNRRKVYSEFSDKVFAILERYSPEVHALSIDEGVVDLTGTERLFGPPVKTAKEILARLERELALSASGGLSASRMVAKIAATLAKPHGFIFVPPGTERTFLSPLPVERIPGVGPKTHNELLRRGIKTIGDLFKHASLTRRYLDLEEERAGKRSHDHSIGNETTLDQPLKQLEQMEEVLWELVEEVGARLRREEVYARCITVKIRYANFKTITRSKTLNVPTCFDREIFETARELLRKNLAPEGPVRLLGVSASNLLSSGWDESLFDVQKRRSWEKLYSGIDRLRRKYGDEAISVATPHTKRQ